MNQAPLLDPPQLRRLVSLWLLDSGMRVRQRRQALNLSRASLARAVNVTPESISRLERGLQAPRDTVRVAIAHALSCDVEDIWKPLPRYQVDLVARKVA
jgi:DNA-binding XRE family transcriptional regulator